MLRRSVSLTLVCLALACSPGGQPASTQTAEAQPGPEPEPTPDPSEGAPTKQTQAQAQTQDPAPTSEDAPTPEPESALPAPTKAEALAACRAAIDPRVAELAPTVVLGPRRHAIALRKRVDDDPTAAELVLAILEGAPGESEAAPATWTVARSLVISRIEGTDYEDGPPRLPTTLLAEDFDDDGEIELELRYREEVMCGGGGLNTITKLKLLDVEPELAVALGTELHHTMAASPVETKAQLSHEDLDGDGHRDVRIRYTTVDGDETQRAENAWIWSAADRWRLRPATKGDATPTYDRWGCDW